MKKRFGVILCLLFSFNMQAQKIGGKVKVLDLGQWISGKLLSIKDGQYFVTFDDKYYKDKLVKEKDIVFIDADDRKPVIVRDTIIQIKYKTDTVYSGKVNPVVLNKVKVDTIYKLLIDTVVIQKSKKDTVYKYKYDTVTIFKTKRDTLIKFKYDTTTIFKNKRDTVFSIKRDTFVINKVIKDTVINTKRDTISISPTPTLKPTTWKVNDLVQVLWNNKWYPASIIEAKENETYKIRFDGYSSSWDEWVGLDRIKKR